MGRTRLVCAILLVLASCIEPRVQHCASGLVCPAGTHCDDVADRCISDEQLLACESLADGEPCTVGGADGVCQNGACIPTSCGDGRISGIEDCEPDLALTIDCTMLGYYEPDGLACGADCRFDESGCVGFCGDGERSGPEACEGEDLGGSTCETFGYYNPHGIQCNPASCTFDLSGCTGRCGDLTLDVADGESCDGSPPDGTCVQYGFDAGPLRCSPFCTPGFTDCGQLGWSSEELGVDTFNAFGVWASSVDDIYLVGSVGRIVHGHRGEWAVENISSGLNAVHGFETEVFAVGTGGQIRRRDPATETWPLMSSDTTAHLDGIWGVAVADLWAVGSGVIDHFDGATWTASASPAGAAWLRAVHGSGDVDVWAVGDGGTIVHWDGTTWSNVASPTSLDLDDVWASGPSDAWAVGWQLLHWDGVSWIVYSDALPGHMFTGVWGASRDDVTVVDDFGVFQHWDGTTWVIEDAPAGGAHDLFGIDGMLLGAGGSSTLVLREATTWTTAPEVAPHVARAWAASPVDVWTIDVAGGLHHWDGVTWSPVSEVTGFLQSVWGSGPTDIWAVGLAGAFWHYDGLDWTSLAIAGGDSLFTVSGFGPDDVWVFGLNGSYHWDGSTWTPDGLAGYYRWQWGSGPDDIWALGRFGQLAHYDGTQWTDWPFSLSYEMDFDIWGTAADDVWAVSWSGLLFHFDGTDWTQVESLAINNTVLHGTAPDDVFVFGDHGTARHYDGTAWAPIRPQVAFAPRAAWGDRGRITVAGDAIDLSAGVVSRLTCHTRWSCRASEVACGDAIDDDCDTLVDADDPDCYGAIVLSQVSGGTDDFIEVRNDTTTTVSLAGLTVAWNNGCSAKSQMLSGAAIVKPGAVYRVIADRTPEVREGWSEALCDEPDDGGWVALCAGSCDLVGCANILDFVAMTGTSAPAGIPSCAGTQPSPVAVSGVTATQSLHRTAVTTTGAKGAAADWAVAPATRD